MSKVCLDQVGSKKEILGEIEKFLMTLPFYSEYSHQRGAASFEKLYDKFKG